MEETPSAPCPETDGTALSPLHYSSRVFVLQVRTTGLQSSCDLERELNEFIKGRDATLCVNCYNRVAVIHLGLYSTDDLLNEIRRRLITAELDIGT